MENRLFTNENGDLQITHLVIYAKPFVPFSRSFAIVSCKVRFSSCNMASKDDIVTKLSTAVCNALRKSQQQVRVKGNS